MHSSTCDSLKAALEKRLRASSSAPFNSSIQVRAISDGGPPAYIVKAAQSCGPILAEQLPSARPVARRRLYTMVASAGGRLRRWSCASLSAVA